MRKGWNKYKFKDVATAIKGKLPNNKNENGWIARIRGQNFLAK